MAWRMYALYRVPSSLHMFHKIYLSVCGLCGSVNGVGDTGRTSTQL